MAFDYKPLTNSRLKIEALNRPEGWEIFNLPKRIKTASIEKSKDTDLGGFDLTAELKKHPESLYIKIFAIKEDEPNDNGDCFSGKELKTAATTFVGVPIFTNHQNDDVEKSRGECVHAWYDPEAKGVFIVARVDKVAYPKLARGIEEGYITGTSMGCSVEYSCCSICHNKAHTADEYCSHIKEAKNRKRNGSYDCKFHSSPCKPDEDCPVCGCEKGKKVSHKYDDQQVFEWNHGLKFIENSFVVNPACHSCGVTCILHAPEVTKKIAELIAGVETLRYAYNKNPNMFEKAAEAGLISQTKKIAQADGSSKVVYAGQIELDMLKQSMDNLKTVSNSMLAQSDHIDVEFVKQIVEAMKIVQDARDELADLGYGQLQSPDLTAANSLNGGNPTFPSPVANQPKVGSPQQSNGGVAEDKPKPTESGQSEILGGLGSITQPKKAEVSNQKKDLTAQSYIVMKKLASLKDALANLDRNLIMAEPVVNLWESSDPESHHVLIDKQHVTFAKGDQILKVASITDLPEDMQSLIRSEPEKAAKTILENQITKESEAQMADKQQKVAQVGPTTKGNPAQREVITEKQLSNNPPKTHPRWGNTYEQITESNEQLGRSDDKVNDTTTASPTRRLGTYDTITEDQLDKISEGYIVRAKDAPDVITEKQWSDWSRMISAELPDDWTQTITEDQLRKLLSNHTYVGTYETITEDQLKHQDLGIKRWASKSYTNALMKVAFEALSDCIAKFKKSPDDLRRVAASVIDSPAKLSKVALLSIINSLPHKAEDRKNVIANASYFSKMAGVSAQGVDTLDSLIVCVAENAKAGLKAEDVFETIAHVLRQKTALGKVEKLAQTKLAGVIEDTHVDKFAALQDAISSLDGYDIRVAVEDLKADPKNKKAFNQACRKYAATQIGNGNFKIKNIRVAQDAGLVRLLIEALEDVEQKMNGGEMGMDGGHGDDVAIEFVGDDGIGGGEHGDLGEEIEEIEPALEGPGGTDVVDDLDDDEFGHLNNDESEDEEDKAMMGGAFAAPSGAGAVAPVAQPNVNGPAGGGAVMSAAQQQVRTAARQTTVKKAQMMGGQMGGQGGAAQGPGAGASLPTPPDMNQQPVESFSDQAPEGEEGAGGEDDMGEKKAKPPGAICPVCGSDDVDLIGGEGKCGNCGSEWVIKVVEEVTKWADLTGEGEGKEGEDEFGGEGFEMPEGGAVDGETAAPGGAGAGAGAGGAPGGMPEVPVAAMTKISPNALMKLAAAKIDLGRVSPVTGSTNTLKVSEATKEEPAKFVCLDSGCSYTVDFRVEANAGKQKLAYAQWEWTPPVAQNVCPSCERQRRALVKALSGAGITEAQFDSMQMSDKAKLLLKLKKAGALNKVKTAATAVAGSVKQDFKRVFAQYGSKFPIESCREKLARRYGKNALAMSGPCEGKPLYDCVCNSLKNAGVYSHGLAAKVAFAWSDQDGQEECVEDLVRWSKLPLREAASACSLLKSALASNEDMLADEIGGEEENGGGNEGMEGEDKGGPPTDVDNEVDPFDGDDDGFESSDGEEGFGSDSGEENGEGGEGDGNVPPSPEGGLPGAGGGATVTLELPTELASQLAHQVTDALTNQGGEGGAQEGGLEGGMPELHQEMPQGDATGLSSEPVDGGLGGVEEVGGPAELGLDKPMMDGGGMGGGMSGGGAMGGQMKPMTANPQNSGGQRRNPSNPGVMNNNQNTVGNGVMAQSKNDLQVQAELDAATYMKSRVGGVGKAAGLDYSALAAKLGLKVAAEKEIQHERVQDSKDIGQYSAGKPASGKTVGQMGHENETIRDAKHPSVPRADALMGHESDNIDKSTPLPRIPSDKGTMGHESEVGLSGGDVRFTGGYGGGGAGSPGAGDIETAGSDDNIVTAHQGAELRAMRGIAGNSKDRTNLTLARLLSDPKFVAKLPSKIADKLQPSKPVSEDPDVEPYSNGRPMGHEHAFSAEEPTDTEASGNQAEMGHENETLGSVPKTPKDQPTIPGGNDSKEALMGHEGDNNSGPEKKTENKGTVIAKNSNAESRLASQNAAFAVAAKLLTAGVIQEGQLQEKVTQLAQYRVEQIRDYEKAVFANVNAKKRGLTTASEGLERPLVINEASSRKQSVDQNLVAKIQSLLSLDKKNKLAEETPDFNIRNYR